jgi:hypothetical protein
MDVLIGLAAIAKVPVLGWVQWAFSCEPFVFGFTTQGLLATIGYIVREFFKWVGYCSPATYLELSDILVGPAATSKRMAPPVIFVGIVATHEMSRPILLRKSFVAGDAGGSSCC